MITIFLRGKRKAFIQQEAKRTAAVNREANMHRFLSQKFRFYTFVCIALLLFVHGYNLQVSYLAPFSLVDEKLTFTTFTEYLFANGLLRFRIPMLFIISGYIFSIQDKRPYGQRAKRRFVTLMIPFFVWSAIGLAVTYLWQRFPVTSQAVQNAALDQLGDNRPYEKIGWGGILYRWLVAPVSFQLWFIRSLFVYNLLYPVFKWGVTKFPIPTFIVLGVLWLSFYNAPLIEGQGMFFFAAGIYLQKRSFPLERKPEWYSPFLNWLVFIGICIIKTFVAFEFDALTLPVQWTLMLLYACATVAGVLAVWFSLDKVVRWCMSKRWFIHMTNYSFFIYGFHIPLLSFVTNLFFIYFHSFQFCRFFTYLAAPTLVYFFCLGAGALLRRFAPGVFKVVTGGRGF
ncbi:acyltransferase family protein [Flavisolibacter ginsenosidimutans]|nr:acyltransferase [Flavisolibacter ginsenosidimutans]